ncbi:MAG: DUF5361 domain-containing protein [Enterococcus hirae]|nr:DUF5361 domain-containing protein [Enterococcus hirae]
MINLDEEALICDLAETYQIYDYRQLPVSKVAVFSCGLRENSRIKMKLNNQSVSFETLLLTGISDKLSVLLWSKTKDAEKGKNLPKMITDEFIPYTNERNKLDTSIFDSSEDFEQRRNELINQVKRGGERQWQQN